MLYGYLFISNHDENGYCKSLITLLERHGLTKIFEPKLIDKMKPEQIMQLQIENIPALLVINDQTKTQQFFEGNDAFKWIDNLLIGRRQSVIKNAENQRKLIQTSNIKENLKEGFVDYCPNEQGGLGEGYAYYHEDENIDRERTITQIEKLKKFGECYEKNDPRRYQNDNLGAIPIKCKNMKEYKEKEGLSAVYGGDIEKVMKQMKDDRDKQNNIIKNNMEQDTLHTIVNKMNQN